MRAQTTASSVVAARPLRIAAIDVGSNSIHMVIAQAESGGGLTTIARMKEMVGLGRSSFPSKNLTKEAMRRALLVLGRFQQAAQQRGADKIIAVATSAVREAENGGDFLQSAWDQLQMRVRIVSAREEARLIYLAVRRAMPLKRDPHLIIDIGGGSVEFIVGNEKQAMVLESRKLGAARMSATFIRNDPIMPAEKENLINHYRKELSSIREAIGPLKPTKTIGTSGTIENLGAMSAVNGESTPEKSKLPAVIERAAFETVLAKLLKSTDEQRANMPGLDSQRKDQIITGALLVQEIFEIFNIRRIQICPMAMREGIILDYLARHMPDLAIRADVPDPRRRSIIDLGRRCNWHRGHAEHVTQLALQLFDQTRSLHGLTPIERELLEYAALLHDIGWHISGKSHHKHSMYLILNGDLKNFTKEEIGILACVARYHRKSLPKASHPHYSTLPRRAKRVVNILASLLRIADSLDRSHCAVVQSLRFKEGDKKGTLTINVRADAQLELWAAKRKCDLFEMTFGKIDFELGKR
ncbi:MAG TPA: Ppx/GppA phosphatase family protein [Tepidisphaeraceae bacterium]|jgi:exopolyphosphatase/guanosine-5'-triphosphate,3'-diphosphate pyrophosphatase